MPRNMSFALTTDQFRNRTKDVTRRLGWDFLQPGDLLWGVKKAMGLQKGEKVERLGLIEVVSATPEPLEAITQEDVIGEGFPEWTPLQFIDFFCSHNSVTPETIVNRIEFRHIGVLLSPEMIKVNLKLLQVFLKGNVPGDLVFWGSDLWESEDMICNFLIGENGLESLLANAYVPDAWPNHHKALDYIKRANGRR